jgi:hypothetical protein
MRTPSGSVDLLGDDQQATVTLPLRGPLARRADLALVSQDSSRGSPPSYPSYYFVEDCLVKDYFVEDYFPVDYS